MAVRNFCSKSFQLLSSRRLKYNKLSPPTSLSPLTPSLFPPSLLCTRSLASFITSVGQRGEVGERSRERGEGRVLGIRREESSMWERRAPLSPNHVQSLISRGIKVWKDLTYQQYIIIIPTLYMNEGLNFSSKMYPFMHRGIIHACIMVFSL